MNSDSSFVIGKTHKVCQDYATHGVSQVGRYAIVSDGCSGSPDTDFGARLIARAATWHTPELAIGLIQDYHNNVIKLANKWADELLLPTQTLDATLLSIIAHPYKFYASVFGDGVIVTKCKDGTITVYSVAFEDGAPYYMTYTLDEKRKEVYRAHPNNNKEVSVTIFDSNWNITADTKEPLDEDVLCINKTSSQYEWAAVLSDGVHSFTEASDTSTSISRKSVNYLTVIPRLLSFKGFQGEFVHRRMQKFQKDAVVSGWQHNDDLSVAVVEFGE